MSHVMRKIATSGSATGEYAMRGKCDGAIDRVANNCDGSNGQTNENVICDKRPKGQRLVTWMKGGAKLMKKGLGPIYIFNRGF